MTVKCKFFDSFGYTRVGILDDFSFDSLARKFELLSYDEICNLSINNAYTYATGNYIQYIYLGDSPLVYSVEETVKFVIKSCKPPYAKTDIHRVKVFIDSDKDTAIDNLQSAIYINFGYIIEPQIFDIKYGVFQLAELEDELSIEPARKI
jgi:hypothetical protein